MITEVKNIKIEYPNGSISDLIPIGTNAENVNMVNGNNLENEIEILNDKDVELSNFINLQKSRIDNLTSLEEGSTTGDAELLDIRTGYNGINYNSAGEAVRAQASTNADKIKIAEEKLDKNLIYNTGSKIFTSTYTAGHNNYWNTSAVFIKIPISDIDITSEEKILFDLQYQVLDTNNDNYIPKQIYMTFRAYDSSNNLLWRVPSSGNGNDITSNFITPSILGNISYLSVSFFVRIYETDANGFTLKISNFKMRKNINKQYLSEDIDVSFSSPIPNLLSDVNQLKNNSIKNIGFLHMGKFSQVKFGASCIDEKYAYAGYGPASNTTYARGIYKYNCENEFYPILDSYQTITTNEPIVANKCTNVETDTNNVYVSYRNNRGGSQALTVYGSNAIVGFLDIFAKNSFINGNTTLNPLLELKYNFNTSYVTQYNDYILVCFHFWGWRIYKKSQLNNYQNYNITINNLTYVTDNADFAYIVKDSNGINYNPNYVQYFQNYTIQNISNPRMEYQQAKIFENDNHIYCAFACYDGGMQVFDITDLSNVTEICHFNMADADLTGYNIFGMDVKYPYLYGAVSSSVFSERPENDKSGLLVVNINDNTDYKVIEIGMDNLPPLVSSGDPSPSCVSIKDDCIITNLDLNGIAIFSGEGQNCKYIKNVNINKEVRRVSFDKNNERLITTALSSGCDILREIL